MAQFFALTPLNAANFESGTAANGEVLTADGAGGAAWEAPAGGGGGGALLDTLWNTVNTDLCIATERNNTAGSFAGTERQMTNCGPGTCDRGMLVSFPLGASMTSVGSAVLRLANSSGGNLICLLRVEVAVAAAAPAISENLSLRTWIERRINQSFVQHAGGYEMQIDITRPVADALASVGSINRVNVWLKAYAASGTHFVYMNEGAVPPALSLAAGLA